MRRPAFGLIIAVPLMAASFATPAYGYANPGAAGRAATAPGQVQAFGNCIDVIARQEANGQTRFSNTLGSETAVTNCDHFWQYND